MDLSGKTLEQIRLDERIGQGGMGAVYRGFDLRLKRPVAVKVLRSKRRRTSEARGRFLREARLLSRLDHPGICRVFDLIEHPSGDLLVLELIRGHTLGELMWRADPERSIGLEPGLERRLRLALEIADALAAAHRQLILHRDLKPDNVMVTENGQVKLLDFGIARSLYEGEGEPDVEMDPRGAAATAEEEEATLFAGALGAPDEEAEPLAATPDLGLSPDLTFRTLRGATVGTVAYMSPEQALGHELNAASDMYAFGILLQELFTGRRAYPTELGAMAVFHRVARAEPEPLVGQDEELAALIRALELREPSRRPTAAQARERLQRLIDRPARRRRRRRRLLAVLAALLLAALALGLLVDSRLEARRQAALADRFAQRASAVEWFLRAEHLSPVHDLRPARQRVAEQLSALSEALLREGGAGRSAGSYALGRAYLVLDDLESARRYLEASWEGDSRRPEVASYLGLTLLRLYQERKERAERLPDDAARAARLEELRVELAEPGIEKLRLGSFAGKGSDSRPLLAIEPDHFPRALAAFAEGDLDAALEHAERSARVWPWFYEARLLAAEILVRRAENAAGEQRYGEAVEHLLAARESARLAASTARSDPRASSLQCRVENELLELEVFATKLDSEELVRSFEIGQEACRQALEIDPEAARPLRLLAHLIQRGAEASALESASGDPRQSLAEAAELARRSLDLDPEDAASWKALGDIHSMWADWEMFRGLDPTAAVDRTEKAYRQAILIHPRSSSYLNALGNALCFRGEIEALRGRDPRLKIGESSSVYRQARDASPQATYAVPLLNLAICEATRIRFEIEAGLDPRSSLGELGAVFEQLEAERRGPGQSVSAYFHRQRGEERRLLAIERAWRGRLPDARRHIEEALEAFGRIEAAGRDLHAITQHLGAHLTAGWLKVLVGEDPSDSLDAAAAAADELLQLDSSWQPARLLVAKISRLEAAWRLERGEPVRGAVERGRRALDPVLEDDPDLAPAHLELLRLALVEAAASARGRGPGAAEASRGLAEKALEAAAEIWPSRPDVALARAAYFEQKARLDPASAAVHRAEAKRQVARALELRRVSLGAAGEPSEGWLSSARSRQQMLWPL
ncbi:MAG: protein kinase [Acidobacteriota bacterium]